MLVGDNSEGVYSICLTFAAFSYISSYMLDTAQIVCQQNVPLSSLSDSTRHPTSLLAHVQAPWRWLAV